MRPWSPAAAGGLRLMIRVTPRAGRDAIGGLGVDADGRSLLLVRLAAAPVEGAANAACIALLATALGVRRSAIRLDAGETARIKRLHVAGDAAAIAARLEALLQAPAP